MLWYLQAKFANRLGYIYQRVAYKYLLLEYQTPLKFDTIATTNHQATHLDYK